MLLQAPHRRQRVHDDPERVLVHVVGVDDRPAAPPPPELPPLPPDRFLDLYTDWYGVPSLADPPPAPGDGYRDEYGDEYELGASASGGYAGTYTARYGSSAPTAVFNPYPLLYSDLH